MDVYDDDNNNDNNNNNNNNNMIIMLITIITLWRWSQTVSMTNNWQMMTIGVIQI